jgi:hypothetical protein
MLCTDHRNDQPPWSFTILYSLAFVLLLLFLLSSHCPIEIAVTGIIRPLPTIAPSLVPLRERYRTPECLSYGFYKALPVTQDVVLKVHGLVPSWFGGLGNQFLAFIHGLFLSYIFGYEQILVQGSILCFRRSFMTTDGLRVWVDWKPPNVTIVEMNSFEADGSPECPLDDVAIAATIRAELVACLPPVAVNESALYICARGGELIIRGTPFWWHGQPPCHYFLDAMEKDGSRQTFVMSNGDNPSPCVSQLVARGAVYASKETPDHDFARFIGAKRIVTSRTSFLTAIMLLSKPKDVVYAFVTQYSMCVWPNHSFLNDYFDRFGPHHKCRATEEYDEKVLKRWSASEEQMEILEKTKKGCVWEYG